MNIPQPSALSGRTGSAKETDHAQAETRRVKLVQQEYQPTKAEQKEQLVLRKADGTVPTLTEVMRAMTRPAVFEYAEKPRQ